MTALSRCKCYNVFMTLVHIPNLVIINKHGKCNDVMTVFNSDLISIVHQWRIQDFPEVGTPTLEGVGGLAPIYDFAYYPKKTA